jgi:hypothetical protein
MHIGLLFLTCPYRSGSSRLDWLQPLVDFVLSMHILNIYPRTNLDVPACTAKVYIVGARPPQPLAVRQSANVVV